METITLHSTLLWIQHFISFLGILIIFSGVLFAIYQYFYFVCFKAVKGSNVTINSIRLNLGRVLILGLEFIVASDLIGTTTTPDYYSVGIVASIVLIRTFLSFSLSHEMVSLSKEELKEAKR